MIALDCSAPATDPPVAPFGSGVKSVPHRGHQRKILTKGGSVTIEDIQLNSWKAMPSSWEPLVPDRVPLAPNWGLWKGG